MEQRKLGDSGLYVSVLGLGGNTFGLSCDAEQTAEIVNNALDSGVTFIDTADAYSKGRSEEYIGRALKGRREEAILATKTGWPQDQEDRGRLSRRRLLAAVDASLRRLGTDYIDLFYLHHPDPDTPIEETLATLDKLVRDGKVRYLGCSNYPGWQLATMAGMAQQANWTPLIASQSEYSLIDREIEKEVLPAARWFGYGLVAFAPLASGFLTGKYRRGEPVPAGVRGAGNPAWQGRRLTNRNFLILEHLEKVAAKHGLTVPDIAVAWVAAQEGVSSVLVGATSPDQFNRNVEAVGRPQSTEAIDGLTQGLDEAASH